MNTFYRYEDKQGNGALNLATVHGHIDVVKTLLQHGAVIDAIDHWDQRKYAPLHLAAKKGDIRMIQFLLHNGAQVDVQGTLGTQPIHLAAEAGSVEALAILLDAGAAVDCSDDQRCRPLYFATERGNLRVIQFLIIKGAQVTFQGLSGRQSVHLAAEAGSVEILDISLDAGAAVDCSNDHGYQPLYLAATTRDGADAIRFLASKGANIEGQRGYHSGWHQTALQAACRWDYAENVRTLLALGAATMGLEEWHETSILDTAISNCSLKSLEVILEHGIDPNRRHSDGRTALMNLAGEGHRLRHESDYMPLYELLLKYHSSVHARDESGDTALHPLAGHPNIDGELDYQVAELLLAYGASAHAKNNLEQTPFSLASYWRRSWRTLLLLCTVG